MSRQSEWGCVLSVSFPLHPERTLCCHFPYILTCQTRVYGLFMCLKFRLFSCSKFANVKSRILSIWRLRAAHCWQNLCASDWRQPLTRSAQTSTPHSRDSFLAQPVFVLTHSPKITNLDILCSRRTLEVLQPVSITHLPPDVFQPWIFHI